MQPVYEEQSSLNILCISLDCEDVFVQEQHMLRKHIITASLYLLMANFIHFNVDFVHFSPQR